MRQPGSSWTGRERPHAGGKDLLFQGDRGPGERRPVYADKPETLAPRITVGRRVCLCIVGADCDVLDAEAGHVVGGQEVKITHIVGRDLREPADELVDADL